MAKKHPGQAAAPAPDAPKDPAELLVSAIGALSPADRDLVYAWLLRRDTEPGVPAGPPRARAVSLTTRYQPDVFLGPGAVSQTSSQQMVPVRFPAEQHARLREWCAEHGFSMATVIRGLVARFLEGQLPGPAQPG
ncbi:MAG TPA: plasmid partition protein ParG [Streptosporangiaceae bacterium]|nr:plasmid partition protein ParG [Streptosporangiaceae bacterium]